MSTTVSRSGSCTCSTSSTRWGPRSSSPRITTRWSPASSIPSCIWSRASSTWCRRGAARRREGGSVLTRRSDLPLKGDAAGRFLPWIAAAMVYLAALALAGAFALDRATQRWQEALTGTLTVEIPPAQARSAGEERLQGERVRLALDVLRAAPGVERAEAMDRARTLKLIEPWLGAGALLDDLPLPTLIEVTLDRRTAVDLKALGQRLDDAVPEARLDDHALWLGGIAALARAVEA